MRSLLFIFSKQHQLKECIANMKNQKNIMFYSLYFIIYLINYDVDQQHFALITNFCCEHLLQIN